MTGRQCHEERVRVPRPDGAAVILDDARSTIPRMPLALGLAGLIPFWGLAVAIPAGDPFGLPAAGLAFALQGYGALIVSFLGGIRWGLATAAPQGRVAQHYAIAVVPSLLAWAALALPAAAGLASIAILALALGAVDRALVRERIAPPWYGRLRLILSGGAGGALILAAILVALRR